MPKNDKPDNSNDKGKLIDLKDKRAKKQRSQEDDKVHISALFKAVAYAIDEHKLNLLPDFPHRYHLVNYNSCGQGVYIERDGGVLELTTEKRLAQDILCYSHEITKQGLIGYEWTIDKAKQCVGTWMSLTTPLKSEPEAVLFANEEGLCYRRLPWDRTPDSSHTWYDCPSFMDVFDRFTNPYDVIAFIGSLFFKEADRQQYVWIYGEGGDGKGFLSRFLKYVFAGAYQAIYAPGTNANMPDWNRQLIGKRCVVFADSNASGFVKSGAFKSLTGGDTIPVNPKFKDPYDYDPICKIMIFSNTTPDISSGKADTRRLIYSEAQTLPEDRDKWGPKKEREIFETEGGIFINLCMRYYLKKAPDHGAIPVDEEAILDLAAENESALEALCDRELEFDDNCYFPTTEFSDFIEQFFRTKKEQREFKAYLKRRKGVVVSHGTRTTKMIEGECVKCYRGFKRKGKVRSSAYAGNPLVHFN